MVKEAQKQGAWGYPADTAFYPVRDRLEPNTLTIFYPDGEKAGSKTAWMSFSERADERCQLVFPARNESDTESSGS